MIDYYICRPVKKEPPYWNHKWAIAQDIDWYKNQYKEKK